jgi:hypothetical protein
MSRAEAIAMMQKVDERTAVYFAASVVGLAFILSTAYFAGVMLMKSNPTGTGVLARNLIKNTRYALLF